MAKTKVESGGARSNRFRMIVIDSDLSDDAIGNLTQAITHALRPAGTAAAPTRALTRGSATSQQQLAEPNNETEVAEPDDIDAEEEAAIGDNGSPAAPARSGTSTPKKLPIPDYLHDLDMTGNGVLFKDYVAKQVPTTHQKRYLVAAAWLKNHGGQDRVNQDRVFTCYRTAGWPMSIKDWDVNFRNHVRADRMRRVAPGEYIITPLGEEEMKKDGAQ